jgi:selenocysteine-specific translation elongation factor
MIKMPNVKGITTIKNIEGKITHVTIDVEEYKDVITPMLYELGVMEKTAFQIECEKGISPEDLRKHLLTTVDNLWKK